MSYFDDYTGTFADIIEGELINTLCGELSIDLGRSCAEEIVRSIGDDHEERYLLIDTETGQLESRRLYDTLEEAEKAIKEPPLGKSMIGVLLVNMP